MVTRRVPVPLAPRLAVDWRKAGLAAIIALYAVIAFNVLGYGFWRHDGLPYLESYESRLITEGRWVNFLLFDLLRAVPQEAAWIISFSCFAWFFYFISMRVLENRDHAVLAAAAFMATPALFAQLNASVTILPAALLLALSTLLVDRVRYAILIPLLSVLNFGMYSWIIYLFPLLYLDRRFTASRARWIWWTKFVCVWALSFVAGFIFANMLVFRFTGTGIQIADWRQPDPATDFGGLAANIGDNFLQIPVHVANLLPAVIPLLVAGLILVIRFPRQERRWEIAGLFTVIGLTLVVCHYVIVAPAGITIQYRTLVPVHVGLTLIFLSLYFVADRRAVVVLGFLLIGLPAWYASYRNVHWFCETSSAIRADVRRHFPEGSHAYAGIIVDTAQFRDYYRRVTAQAPDRYGEFFEGLNTPYRWVRALTEEGFENVELCPAAQGRPRSRKCLKTLANFRQSACDDDPASICVLGVTRQNELVVRLQGASPSSAPSSQSDAGSAAGR